MLFQHTAAPEYKGGKKINWNKRDLRKLFEIFFQNFIQNRKPYERKEIEEEGIDINVEEGEVIEEGNDTDDERIICGNISIGMTEIKGRKNVTEYFRLAYTNTCHYMQPN